MKHLLDRINGIVAQVYFYDGTVITIRKFRWFVIKISSKIYTI